MMEWKHGYNLFAAQSDWFDDYIIDDTKIFDKELGKNAKVWTVNKEKEILSILDYIYQPPIVYFELITSYSKT
jgi:hypothetical protein